MKIRAIEKIMEQRYLFVRPQSFNREDRTLSVFNRVTLMNSLTSLE
ncbi:hypothetical protein [Peribacillus simplex]